MPKIIDNARSYLLHELRDETAEEDVHRIDACVGYFNLRGWSKFTKPLDQVTPKDGQPRLRLLIGMLDSPDRELQRHLNGQDMLDNSERNVLYRNLREQLSRQLTYGTPTRADETTLLDLQQRIRDGQVVIRAHLAYPMHAKLYITHRRKTRYPHLGFVGSSNLTLAGLEGQGELNVDVSDEDATGKLVGWFEERWDDDRNLDITDELLELIDASWAHPKHPYHVYLKMVYHLSTPIREGVETHGIPPDLERLLLPHQKTASQFAAARMAHRGGAIVGDVTGLGKTLIAIAAARLRQNSRGGKTLVVCPRNLVNMWEHHCEQYGVSGKVLTFRGTVNRLSDLYGWYGTVIVDESHNLRHRTRQDYKAIKSFIGDHQSKVMLLTATPYNREFSDVANQLALFVEETAPLGIRPALLIENVGTEELTKRLQRRKLFDCSHDTLAAFRLSEHPSDWRRLMDRYLIRRTRRYIEQAHARDVIAVTPANKSRVVVLPSTGRVVTVNGRPAEWKVRRARREKRFDAPTAANSVQALPKEPERLRRSFETIEASPGRRVVIGPGPEGEPPVELEPGDTVENRKGLLVGGELRLIPTRRCKGIEYTPGPDAEVASKETLNDVDTLHLPRYNLARYWSETRPEPPGGYTDDDREQTETWANDPTNRGGRNLAGFSRTLLYKRLSSSGPAFIISLERHLLRNRIRLHALREGLPIPHGDSSTSLDIPPEDTDSLHDAWDDTEISGSGTEMLDLPNPVDAYQHIRNIKNPAIKWLSPQLFQRELEEHLQSDNQRIVGILDRIGEWNQAADTKLDALCRLVTEIHPDEKVLVFSEFADTTEYVARSLRERGVAAVRSVSGTHRDPGAEATAFSPKSNNAEVPPSEQTRVLVATDVLSEGQNLQDAHIVVNYDLPWAVVKLVQRAGRVDRIGQESPHVRVVTMLPPGGVEEVLDLRKRIRDRLAENARVFGGGERFFGDAAEAAILTEVVYEGEDPTLEEEGEVDVTSRAYDIWTDAEAEHPEHTAAALALPNVVYATQTKPGQNRGTGAVTHLQDREGINAFAYTESNSGIASVITPSEVLDLVACHPDTPKSPPLADHHQLVETAKTGPLRQPAAAVEGQTDPLRTRAVARLREHLAAAVQPGFQTVLGAGEADTRRVLNDLHRWPLKRTAVDIVLPGLKELTVSDFATKLIRMRNDDELCVNPAEHIGPPQIICSMGFNPR